MRRRRATRSPVTSSFRLLAAASRNGRRTSNNTASSAWMLTIAALRLLDVVASSKSSAVTAFCHHHGTTTTGFLRTRASSSGCSNSLLLVRDGNVVAPSSRRVSTPARQLGTSTSAHVVAPPSLLSSRLQSTQRQQQRKQQQVGTTYHLSSANSVLQRYSYSYHQARSSSSFPSSSPHTVLLMTAVDEDEATDSIKTLTSTWNIAGLKKEVQRLVLRCHKKVGKASQRLRSARETVEQLRNDENASLEALEQCPNLDALQLELTQLQERLRDLRELEECLQLIKKRGESVLPPDVAQLALDLGVNDEPPQRQPRGPPKKKGPRSRTSTRLPYRRYYSVVDNIEIRVGKKAHDNDDLTLKHRDGAHWWMHAAGCPGSHVVICCTDNQLNEEVVQDAASLAARQSKASGNPVVKVSLTRCRDVVKPPGAKPGLVQITGKVQTVTVRMKEAQSRLERLDATVLVN